MVKLIYRVTYGYLENPLDPLDPRPTTLDPRLDFKKVSVYLYNYNFYNNIRKTYTQQTRGNVVLMLARRLQRRHNIKTILCQCLVLAGYRPTVMLTWLSGDVEPMSGQ